MADPAPVTIAPTRNMTSATGGIIVADAVMLEDHDDELVMTDHPVEQGAVITDHAYKMPAVLVLLYGWSNSSDQPSAQNNPTFLKGLYEKLLALQFNRVLVTVLTGKREYRNMLLRRVKTLSDKDNENSMTVRVECREVIMAQTTVVLLTDTTVQAFPQKTASPLARGDVSTSPATNWNQQKSLSP